MKKNQPSKVKKYFCPRCKELMCKIYPWASLDVAGEVTPCKKCLNKILEKKQVTSFNYKSVL